MHTNEIETITPKHGISWKEAYQAGPGPSSLNEAAILALKGFCMGTADIIPGVSGGTIAFIMGIYDKLLEAIASFDMVFLKHIVRFNIKSALTHAHLKFLLPMVIGIGTALLSTAGLMHYLLHEYPEPTWSLFFGLIGASIVIVGKKITNWSTGSLFLVLGAIGAYFLVGMIPRTTPETWWFVFLSGSIAICAMILPGISGSFILLLMGKYLYITGALKNPVDVKNLLTLIIFACGALLGIIIFSRFLNYLLDNYRNATMALLTGFMAGAMRKIWPWQHVEALVSGNTTVNVTTNVLPRAFDRSFALDIGLIIFGLALVFLLEYYSRTPGRLAHEGE
ncbi:MAG: DUF368 domain-containing protein [Deltaproteobacteria bacterium]|nr:DUF368 domain-containing protein [Deltaproteobacteria bacterium]